MPSRGAGLAGSLARLVVLPQERQALDAAEDRDGCDGGRGAERPARPKPQLSSGHARLDALAGVQPLEHLVERIEHDRRTGDRTEELAPKLFPFAVEEGSGNRLRLSRKYVAEQPQHRADAWMPAQNLASEVIVEFERPAVEIKFDHGWARIVPFAPERERLFAVVAIVRCGPRRWPSASKCGCRIFAGEARDGFAKIASVHMLDERNDVAALVAASAVPSLFLDVDGEAIGTAANEACPGALVEVTRLRLAPRRSAAVIMSTAPACEMSSAAIMEAGP